MQSSDEIIAHDRRDELADYPLAKAYGWCPRKKTTGGSLFLFPSREQPFRENSITINPDDYTPAARDGAWKRYHEWALGVRRMREWNARKG